eukprot:TRINITY_DN36153_c0_g1_i1.p1 TRINITY_DN36153_c0_g1~~TRINITY_DN36153_c0_g1_i1.p1  ORF type:complete len:1368 (-),score=271.39 TRINITY_DN36153_c0_g1_i1:269-4372(-)
MRSSGSSPQQGPTPTSSTGPSPRPPGDVMPPGKAQFGKGKGKVASQKMPSQGKAGAGFEGAMSPAASVSAQSSVASAKSSPRDSLGTQMTPGRGNSGGPHSSASAKPKGVDGSMQRPPGAKSPPVSWTGGGPPQGAMPKGKQPGKSSGGGGHAGQAGGARPPAKAPGTLAPGAAQAIEQKVNKLRQDLLGQLTQALKESPTEDRLPAVEKDLAEARAIAENLKKTGEALNARGDRQDLLEKIFYVLLEYRDVALKVDAWRRGGRPGDTFEEERTSRSGTSGTPRSSGTQDERARSSSDVGGAQTPTTPGERIGGSRSSGALTPTPRSQENSTSTKRSSRTGAPFVNVVTVKRTDKSRLGLEMLGSTNGSALVVQGVAAGLIDQWNNNVLSSEQKVRRGDRLVEVNQTRGDASALSSLCASAGTLRMVFERDNQTDSGEDSRERGAAASSSGTSSGSMGRRPRPSELNPQNGGFNSPLQPNSQSGAARPPPRRSPSERGSPPENSPASERPSPPTKTAEERSSRPSPSQQSQYSDPVPESEPWSVQQSPSSWDHEEVEAAEIAPPPADTPPQSPTARGHEREETQQTQGSASSSVRTSPVPPVDLRSLSASSREGTATKEEGDVVAAMTDEDREAAEAIAAVAKLEADEKAAAALAAAIAKAEEDKKADAEAAAAAAAAKAKQEDEEMEYWAAVAKQEEEDRKREEQEAEIAREIARKEEERRREEEQEAARKKLEEEEAKRKMEEEEAARKMEEEEAARQEAERRRQEEEAERQLQEEAAARRVEEEAARKKEEEEVMKREAELMLQMVQEQLREEQGTFAAMRRDGDEATDGSDPLASEDTEQIVTPLDELQDPSPLVQKEPFLADREAQSINFDDDTTTPRVLQRRSKLLPRPLVDCCPRLFVQTRRTFDRVLDTVLETAGISAPTKDKQLTGYPPLEKRSSGLLDSAEDCAITRMASSTRLDEPNCLVDPHPAGPLQWDMQGEGEGENEKEVANGDLPASTETDTLPRESTILTPRSLQDITSAVNTQSKPALPSPVNPPSMPKHLPGMPSPRSWSATSLSVKSGSDQVSELAEVSSLPHSLPKEFSGALEKLRASDDFGEDAQLAWMPCVLLQPNDSSHGAPLLYPPAMAPLPPGGGAVQSRGKSSDGASTVESASFGPKGLRLTTCDLEENTGCSSADDGAGRATGLLPVWVGSSSQPGWQAAMPQMWPQASLSPALGTSSASSQKMPRITFELSTSFASSGKRCISPPRGADAPPPPPMVDPGFSGMLRWLTSFSLASGFDSTCASSTPCGISRTERSPQLPPAFGREGQGSDAHTDGVPTERAFEDRIPPCSKHFKPACRITANGKVEKMRDFPATSFLL